MFQYRKVLEMRSDGFSLRSIRAATGHSRQKITEVHRLQSSFSYFIKTRILIDTKNTMIRSRTGERIMVFEIG